MPKKSFKYADVGGQSFKSGYGDSVTQKGSIMDHPGSMVRNVLYSDASNTFKQALEMAVHTPKNGEDLSASKFGLSANVTLSAPRPISHLGLCFRLPALPKDVNMGPGWGYNAYTEVDYQLGAQNSGPITIKREVAKHSVMLACGTTELRNKLIELGGREVLAEQDPSEENVAIIFIAIPGSLPTGDKIRTPVPTNMMTSTGYKITVALSPKEQFMTGAGVATLPFDSFTKVTVFYRQVAVSDSAAVPNINQISNDMSAIYPCIKSDESIKTFPAAAPGTQRTITIDSIPDGDLLGISLSILPDSKYTTDTSTYSNTTNAWDYADIYDVEILKGSDSIDGSPDTTNVNKFFNTAIGGQGGFDFDIPVRTAVGAYEPFWSEPANKTLYYWNNTLRRPQTEPNYMHNAPRYNVGTLQLKFKTSTAESFSLYIITHLTSILKFMKTNAIQST